MDHGSWISSIDHALQHVSGSAFYGLVPKDKHCFFQLILFFRSKSLNSTHKKKKKCMGLGSLVFLVSVFVHIALEI